MNDRPLVSIIIPVKNSAATLEGCLASLRAQTYPNIEVIVVDNYSTDGTLEIARPFARVYQHGPERSAQVNFGARQANGEYLYRIDGDFELEPQVVAACVAAIENEGFDALAVPNRSSGRGFWSRVRALERATYLEDDQIVAARFWKRRVFEALGGLDESLIACEDYDFHNRMEAQGYRLGRVQPGETHHGEADSLWDYAAQSYYYGPSIWRYVRKHPRRGAGQMFPLRAAYLQHRGELARQPLLLLGLIVLKLVQYLAAGAGVLAAALGLHPEMTQEVSRGWGALAMVLAGAWGAARLSTSLGLPPSTWSATGLLLVALLAWQLSARRLAQRSERKVPDSLWLVSLTYLPLASGLFATPELLGALRPGILYEWAGAVTAWWLAGLVYSNAPAGPDGRQAGFHRLRSLPAVIMVLAAVLFCAFFSLRSGRLLAAHAMGAYDVAVYDQALWGATQGAFTPNRYLYSSIDGQSVLARQASPILLALLPLYWAGLGGPGLLLFVQVVALGLASLGLYRLAALRLGQLPALLLGLAFLGSGLVLQIASGNFYLLVLALPLLFFGLEALLHGRLATAVILFILALLCGLEVGICVASLGLVLLIWKEQRQPGAILVALGAGWVFLAGWVLQPTFGAPPGAAFQVYQYASWGEVIQQVMRPASLDYLLRLLLPLGGLPLAGLPWLLAGLPRLALNLAAPGSRFVSLNGWYEVDLLPVLYLAAISAVASLGCHLRARQAAYLAGGALVLTASLVSGLVRQGPGLLVPNDPREADRGQKAAQLLEQVPPQASLATQSTLAVLAAHRLQLSVLPDLQGADMILIDSYGLARELPANEIQELIDGLSRDPIYGLTIADQGFLLFERQAQSSATLSDIARVENPAIQHPLEVTLGGALRYLGFNLSAERVRPGEPFYITHFFECLAKLEHPYLLFSGYPGERRFEPFALGLYPPDQWQVGQVIRQEQKFVLPPLPDGEQYELAIGLWYDRGEPALRSPQQLLGADVIRILNFEVHSDSIRLVPRKATP